MEQGRELRTEAPGCAGSSGAQGPGASGGRGSALQASPPGAPVGPAWPRGPPRQCFLGALLGHVPQPRAILPGLGLGAERGAESQENQASGRLRQRAQSRSEGVRGTVLARGWGSRTPQPEAQGRGGTGCLGNPLHTPPRQEQQPAEPWAPAAGALARQAARHVAGVKALSRCAWTAWTHGNSESPCVLSLPHRSLLGARGHPAAPPPPLPRPSGA